MKLKESVSKKVYHMTTIDNAYKILKQKRFRLTTSVGTDSEFRDKQFYYLSLARNLQNQFFNSFSNDVRPSVIFNLNGEWFNNNYKGKPVDYFDAMWQRQRKVGLKDAYRETEDRVLSYEPYISFEKNINSLINEIHIHFNRKSTKKSSNNYILSLVSLIKKYNIPLFIYENKDDYLLQNKNKSIPISEFNNIIKNVEKSPIENNDSDFVKETSFYPWIELYYKDNRHDLSKKAKEIAYELHRFGDMAIENHVHRLKIDIHNARNTDNKHLVNLIKLLKKKKSKNIYEFVYKLTKKWFKVY